MVTRSHLPFSGVHKVYPYPRTMHGTMRQQYNSSPKNGKSPGVCAHPVSGTRRSSCVTARRSWCAALEKLRVDHQLGQPGCHWNQQGSARGFLFSSFLQPVSFYVPLYFDMTDTNSPTGNPDSWVIKSWSRQCTWDEIWKNAIWAQLNLLVNACD